LYESASDAEPEVARTKAKKKEEASFYKFYTKDALTRIKALKKKLGLHDSQTVDAMSGCEIFVFR